MRNARKACVAIAALLAGAVTGLFGAGGGLILVPLLRYSDLENTAIFPASVAIMLPICTVSLIGLWINQPLPWMDAFPYFLGSIAAGFLVGLFGSRISVVWLHRLLGLFLIWGGIRYLC